MFNYLIVLNKKNKNINKKIYKKCLIKNQNNQI